MIKKILVCILVFVAIAGCSKCILVRSEYYDITGQAFTPKPDDATIDIYESGQDVKRPYAEIGAIKVMARYGTPQENLKQEMIRRARSVGADAVVDVYYAEDEGNDLPLCGKFFATKRNMAASGKAVIFTGKK